MKNDIYNALGVHDGLVVANDLDSIGGNSQEIIDRVQAMYEAGQMVDLFTGKQMNIEECAKDCISGLRGELIRVWINRMSRETVSALLAAFAEMPDAKITLSKDVDVFACEIAPKWNDAHQDEEPVYLPMDEGMLP